EGGRRTALVDARQLPWGQIEKGNHDGQPRADRDRSRRGVEHGAGGTTLLGPPGRSDRGAPEQERVDGQGTRPEQVAWRHPPPSGDIEAEEGLGRIGPVKADKEGKGFALDWLRIVGSQQLAHVS